VFAVAECGDGNNTGDAKNIYAFLGFADNFDGSIIRGISCCYGGTVGNTSGNPIAVQVGMDLGGSGSNITDRYQIRLRDWSGTPSGLNYGIRQEGTARKNRLDAMTGFGRDPTSQLDVSGPIATAQPTTKTTNYSLAAGDASLIFNGSGSITLTLQAASSYPGRWLHVKTIAAQPVVSASSDVVPLDSATAGTAILSGTAGKWASLQSDGTNWIVMAGN
jgi:hypothetical protein